jgi:hypothetical protein
LDQLAQPPSVLRNIDQYSHHDAHELLNGKTDGRPRTKRNRMNDQVVGDMEGNNTPTYLASRRTAAMVPVWIPE